MTIQGGIGLNIPMPPSKIRKDEIMRNLNQRKKLQICRAYLINAIEDFLSSVVNAVFAKTMASEFVANIDSFSLSNQGISYSATNSSLYMYPMNPEQYKIPKKFMSSDSAVSMSTIATILLHKLKIDESDIATLSGSGLDITSVLSVLEVFRKEGSDVLGDKINGIQRIFGIHNPFEESPEHWNTNQKSNSTLIQCMLKIIEEIDPKLFHSGEFQEIKSWIISQ